MVKKSELDERVGKIFGDRWSRRDGKVVPDDTSLTMGNDAIDLNATILYADLRGSTAMVDGKRDEFAAEVYKSFLYCSARILTGQGGTITSYDGDRIMAVFIGDSKNTSAVKAALKIHWAVVNIIQPALKKQYPNSDFVLKHTCGIDTSKVMVAKTGARGANDLVWVGRAANYAAKLSDSTAAQTFITKEVYDNMNKEVKASAQGEAMWKPYTWNSHDKRVIYGSSWTWRLD